MTKEETAVVAAAKELVGKQIDKRENGKVLYFESVLANGTIFEIDKSSLPISKD